MRPGPTSNPAWRRTRPNVTTWPTTPLAGGNPRLLEQFGERDVADALQVLVVLEHRTERRLDDIGIELAAAEGREGLGPVDRLGDARRLLQVEPPKAMDERGRLEGEPLGHAGHAQPHDLDLAIERGVVDPVEERAPLEGVVKLARAVRG